jgi:hypothetical protein
LKQIEDMTSGTPSSCAAIAIVAATIVVQALLVTAFSQVPAKAFKVPQHTMTRTANSVSSFSSSWVALHVASCVGELGTFSEAHQKPRRGSSFTAFGTWYQTMDHRLARPQYDMRFVGDEDLSSPSDRWPAMMMEKSDWGSGSDEVHVETTAPGRRPLASLRSAITWVLGK